MPDFYNLKSLLRWVEKTVDRSMDEIANIIRNVLYDYVQRDWYSAKEESVYYERTYEVLNSIKVLSRIKNKDGYFVEIGFDTSEVHSEKTQKFFNSHMSFDGSTSFGGISIAEWVVIWMSEGQNSPFPYSGVDFLQNTRDFANDESVHLLKEMLKKAGIDDVVIT